MNPQPIRRKGPELPRPHSARALRMYLDTHDKLFEGKTLKRCKITFHLPELKPVAVLDLSAEAHEARREKIAEEFAIAAAYTRGTLDGQVVTDRREDYQHADSLLSALALSPKTKDTKP